MFALVALALCSSVWVHLCSCSAATCCWQDMQHKERSVCRDSWICHSCETEMLDSDLISCEKILLVTLPAAARSSAGRDSPGCTHSAGVCKVQCGLSISHQCAHPCQSDQQCKPARKQTVCKPVHASGACQTAGGGTSQSAALLPVDTAGSQMGDPALQSKSCRALIGEHALLITEACIL